MSDAYDPHDGQWRGPTVQNYYCTDGDDHNWPAELDSDAECDRCGLRYDEWSED